MSFKKLRSRLSSARSSKLESTFTDCFLFILKELWKERKRKIWPKKRRSKRRILWYQAKSRRGSENPRESIREETDWSKLRFCEMGKIFSTRDDHLAQRNIRLIRHWWRWNYQAGFSFIFFSPHCLYYIISKNGRKLSIFLDFKSWTSRSRAELQTSIAHLRGRTVTEGEVEAILHKVNLSKAVSENIWHLESATWTQMASSASTSFYLWCWRWVRARKRITSCTKRLVCSRRLKRNWSKKDHDIITIATDTCRPRALFRALFFFRHWKVTASRSPRKSWHTL